MKAFGMEMTKEALLQRVSSMSQIAGAREFTYTQGKAAGVRAVEVTAGQGLTFTILIDRGMDIGDAYYCGIPIGLKSKVGVIGPTYFENQGHQWLRNFYGGLMTTCGLSQVGEPCVDGGIFHGLHGRISHTPAERYWVDEYWDGEDYVISVTGKMREAIIYGENLVLTREIKCVYGQKKMMITDTIENEGYEASPLMILYHVNQPFPLVSEHSKIYTSADSVDVLNTCNQPGAGDYRTMTKPQKGYVYETFSHNMPMDREKVYTGIINENMQLGMYLAYDPKVLPIGNQWKQLGQQDYCGALEPANTYPVGIKEAREKGYLKTIQAKEKIKIKLEIGVLDGVNEIDTFKTKL